MPLPKVFVSYSAKPCGAGTCARAGEQGGPCAGRCARQDDERGFVTGLVERLHARFEVLWDATALLAGDNWRHELYADFARCQAAVILLTESSVESHYVPLEAMVLAWRRLLDPKFLVIPVFFDPLDENAVKTEKSRFYGIGLEDIQGVKHARGSEQQTYDAIAARLADISESEVLDRIAVVHQLARVLNKVGEALLRIVAEELDAGYQWRPGLPRAFQLALALLNADFAKAVHALASIGKVLDLDHRKQLFDVLAPRWVDLRAAQPLWRARRLDAAGNMPVLAMNAGWKITPEHYLQRAWSHTLENFASMPIAAVDDGSGDGFRSAILHAYYKQFPLPDDDAEWDEGRAADSVIARLKARSDSGSPLYVTVRHGNGVSEHALVEVAKKLPVAIVYVRPDATSDTFAEGVRFLTPPLTPHLEQTARAEWAAAHDVLIGQKKANG